MPFTRHRNGEDEESSEDSGDGHNPLIESYGNNFTRFPSWDSPKRVHYFLCSNAGQALKSRP